MIPQTTTPLTKFIRTLEGWVVVVVNVVLIVVPIVTSSLSAGQAAKYGIIFNSVAVASRSVLKGIASLSPIFGSPITPTGIGSGGGTATTTEAATASSDNLEEGPSMNEVGWSGGETEVDPSVLTELGTPQDQVQYAGAPGELKSGGGTS